MKYDLTDFEKGLEEFDIRISDLQREQFIRYYELLTEWNKVMNLTGIMEFEDVLSKHFLDSLSLVRAVSDLRDQKILDLGTGAGFPGIPLKIVFPDTEILLMDSLNKRVGFLQEVITELRLKKTEAVHGRAEEMARKSEYREQFDLCVSRAVANLSTLTEYCLPFVKTGGRFISYKSADADEEIRQAKKAVFLLGGEIEKTEKFVLPGTDMGRSLICVQKVKNTPKAYPRKAGTPGKKPL